MQQLTNIEQASESFWLWPPIADAVQTFLRRRDHSEDYERLWRMIHIWESIATTLSSVAASRLASLRAKDDYLKVREMLYGRKWDPIDEQIRSIGQGALDGSNDKRIEILNVVAKSECSDSIFINELREFLSTTGVSSSASNGMGGPTFSAELQEFTRAWRRVCDVPRTFERAEPTNEISLYQCLKIINTFRNRFAHVPFPFDPLAALVS